MILKELKSGKIKVGAQTKITYKGTLYRGPKEIETLLEKVFGKKKVKNDKPKPSRKKTVRKVKKTDYRDKEVKGSFDPVQEPKIAQGEDDSLQ